MTIGFHLWPRDAMDRMLQYVAISWNNRIDTLYIYILYLGICFFEYIYKYKYIYICNIKIIYILSITDPIPVHNWDQEFVPR